MDMHRYRQLFLDESREQLTRMGQLLLLLEQAPQERAALDELFRQAHSLKSMAAAMGYDATTRLAHHLEEHLARWRDLGALPAGTSERLLAAVDLLEGLRDDLAAERPERDIAGFLAEVPVPAAASLPLPPALLVYQVSIDLAEETPIPAARALLLLRELQSKGEILNATPTAMQLRQGIACRRLQVWLRTPLSQADMAASLQADSDVARVTFLDDRRGTGGARRWADSTARTVRVRVALLEQVVRHSGELLQQHTALQRAAQARDWTRLDAALAEAAGRLATLYQQALQTRLLPLESIAGRLPRLVRDVARGGGKDAEFRLLGGGVLFDREILEALAEPLMHLVRNAVDHGLVAGVHGTVTVAGRVEPQAVLIEVSDDGRGLDPDALKRQAQAKGLLAPGRAATLTEGDALRLICLPGFSTAPAVSEISGHGVGMDVVNTAVEKLGGTLEIVSAPGSGCCIRLRFPLAPEKLPEGQDNRPAAGEAADAPPADPEAGHALS